MATTRPASASPMPSLPTPAISISATSSRATPGQATATPSRHTRNHTQSTKPLSKFARLRSRIRGTKLFLGAAIGLLTLVVTIVSSLPSFAGARYGKKSLELALWTARKDYIEACQEYLNRTSAGCHQALEKGLQPPPGIDRLAARSLQRLQEEVQRIELQPLIHKANEHVHWLRLWLRIGVLIVGLILTGQWTRFKLILQSHSRRPSYLTQAFELDFASRQREVSVSESALWRSHGLSPATTTGINIKEGQVPSLRHRNWTLAPSPEVIAGGHLVAKNRAAAPAGKHRVSKERKRQEKEHKEEDSGWIRQREIIEDTKSYERSSSYLCVHRLSTQVERISGTLHTPGDVEYEGWEIAHEDACPEALYEASLRYAIGEPIVSEYIEQRAQGFDTRRWHDGRRLWQRREKAINKRFRRLNSGFTHSEWPVQSSKKGTTRKRNLKSRDLHRLDRFEGLDSFRCVE